MPIIIIVVVVAQLVMQVITSNHFTTSINLSHLITFNACVMCGLYIYRWPHSMVVQKEQKVIMKIFIFIMVKYTDGHKK